jgi:hypothetical protein
MSVIFSFFFISTFFYRKNSIIFPLFLHYFSLSLFPFLFPFLLFSNEEKKKEFFSIFISLLKEEKEEKLEWRKGEREKGRNKEGI